MNLNDIRQPIEGGFRPFAIRTSDGREYPVPHKEFLFLTKRSVVVADEEGGIAILDPLHITSVFELGSLPTK